MKAKRLNLLRELLRELVVDLDAKNCWPKTSNLALTLLSSMHLREKSVCDCIRAKDNKEVEFILYGATYNG